MSSFVKLIHHILNVQYKYHNILLPNTNSRSNVVKSILLRVPSVNLPILNLDRVCMSCRCSKQRKGANSKGTKRNKIRIVCSNSETHNRYCSAMIFVLLELNTCSHFREQCCYSNPPFQNNALS